MIAEQTEQKMSFQEYLDQIPDKVSLEQVEDEMKVKINKDLNLEYIKNRLACMVILSGNPHEGNSGQLEIVILNQLSGGDIENLELEKK